MSEGYITQQTKTFESGIRLDSGRILAPITLVYETYGTLNEKKTNAILVEHAWTGDAHLAG
ncbi:MAG TPA: homoserine O-acetyltransferase, partial [Desulfuromonadaceae bacterium]